MSTCTTCVNRSTQAVPPGNVVDRFAVLMGNLGRGARCVLYATGGCMFRSRSVRALAAAFVMLAASAWPASAQIATGTVTGTVTDQSGGTVPGATVVLLSESQGTKLAPQVTNTNGIYVFAGVAADTYTVDVTLSGFKEVTRKGVKVVGGDR